MSKKYHRNSRQLREIWNLPRGSLRDPLLVTRERGSLYIEGHIFYGVLSEEPDFLAKNFFSGYQEEGQNMLSVNNPVHGSQKNRGKTTRGFVSKISYFIFSRFMAIVKQTVERLDTLEESFAPVLLQLGAMHSAKADFSAENIAVFIESLLFAWKSVLKDKMTPECAVAWRTLFSYIMGSLHQGFNAGMSQKRHMSITEMKLTF